jgi:hypothetical protein
VKRKLITGLLALALLAAAAGVHRMIKPVPA